ncbi:MAG: MaoC/PaaZ C-terminal domain-containing protein [Thermoprotei archaeon]
MDYKEGGSYTTPARTITEADIVLFAGLSGDYNRLHTDEEYASRGFFGGRIAHGALTFSVTTGLWYAAGLFRDAKAFYGVDQLRFTKPVRVGDTIHCEVYVSKIYERGGNLLVEFESKTMNQRGELVLTLKGKMLVEGGKASR